MAKSNRAALPNPASETDPTCGPEKQVEVVSGTLFRLDFLEIAESCASTESNKPSLNTIHLAFRQRQICTVGTDGFRIFVGAYGVNDEFTPPRWLEDGLTLVTENLKARIKLAKILSEGIVSIATSNDLPYAEMTAGFDVFRLAKYDGSFVNWQAVLDNVELHRDEMDFAPMAMNSKWLKHVESVGKMLDASKPKDERSANGVPIEMHDAGQGKVVTVVFPTCPGALLLLMPNTLTKQVNAQTGRLLLNANSRTVAALKAHRTRTSKHLKMMKEAAPDNKAVHEELEAEIESYNKRIADVVDRMGAASLPAPKEKGASSDKAEAGQGKSPEPGTPQPPKDEAPPAAAEAPAEASKPDAKQEQPKGRKDPVTASVEAAAAKVDEKQQQREADAAAHVAKVNGEKAGDGKVVDFPSIPDSLRAKPANGKAAQAPAKPANGKAAQAPAKPAQQGKAAQAPAKPAQQGKAAQAPAKPANGKAAQAPAKPAQQGKAAQAPAKPAQQGKAAAKTTPPKSGEVAKQTTPPPATKAAKRPTRRKVSRGVRNK